MINTFELPTKIVFGVGSIAQLGAEAKKLGKKAIVVTYPDIRQIGLLDKVLAGLKANAVEAVVFDKVEPNPRSSTIDQGAALARLEKIDLVVGLGGGSAMDCAKGIALTTTGTDSVWAFAEGRAQPRLPLPPIIQVPTMAGTGAEISIAVVITNWETRTKRLMFNPFIQAKVAIVDPEVTLTVPRNQTKAGAIDSFCHVIEPYIADPANSPADRIREAVMKMTVEYLPKVLVNLDDIEARTQLSWASTMSLHPFVRFGSILVLHGLEHALSGYYDVTHGAGVAALLPAWLRSLLPVRKERLELLGKNVFGKSDGILATEKWLESVEMRLRLRDLGCELERAEEIADLAVRSSPEMADSPAPIDRKLALKIYRDAY